MCGNPALGGERTLSDSNQDLFDVVVVGAGNAAITAALAAHAEGARVAVLEKASKDLRGGNTRFPGGIFRHTYNSVEDLLPRHQARSTVRWGI